MTDISPSLPDRIRDACTLWDQALSPQGTMQDMALFAGRARGLISEMAEAIEQLTRPVVCEAIWINGDGEIMTCELIDGHDSMHRRGQNFASHALNESCGGPAGRYVGKHEAGA